MTVFTTSGASSEGATRIDGNRQTRLSSLLTPDSRSFASPADRSERRRLCKKSLVSPLTLLWDWPCFNRLKPASRDLSSSRIERRSRRYFGIDLRNRLPQNSADEVLSILRKLGPHGYQRYHSWVLIFLRLGCVRLMLRECCYPAQCFRIGCKRTSCQRKPTPCRGPSMRTRRSSDVLARL
jgi:hypothetical protein